MRVTGIETDQLPFVVEDRKYRTWPQMNADVCARSFGRQKAASVASRWDVHSAGPFTPARNATKVW